MSKIPVLGTFVPVIQALIIIWLYLVAAKCLEDVELLNRIGKKTLYLCGCEYFARQLLKSTVRLFGLELSFPRPICAWICAALALYVAMKYLVPVAEQILAALRRFLGSMFKAAEHEVARDETCQGGGTEV